MPKLSKATLVALDSIADHFRTTYPKGVPMSVVSEMSGEKLANILQAKKMTPKKKIPSAYVSFCSYMRPLIKAESPSLTFGELSKELGRKWKLLPDNGTDFLCKNYFKSYSPSPKTSTRNDEVEFDTLNALVSE